MQRYRAAHDDIVEAISKKDKALQGMFRKTDPMILGEIADEAVQSSGIGIYRQKARSGPGDDAKRKISCVNVTAESTSQLRKKFAAVLEVQDDTDTGRMNSTYVFPRNHFLVVITRQSTVEFICPKQLIGATVTEGECN